MSQPTLRQLRYFDLLARHGQFARAAEVAAVSQPALSMQIRELEAILGASLVERGPRGIRLTRLGETLLPRVRDILRSVDALTEVARAGDAGLGGRLNLGVIPTVAPYLLPRIVAALTAAEPGIDIHVRETLTPRLLAELDDGRLDMALIALPSDVSGLAEAPLLSEPFLLVRPLSEAGLPPPSAEALRSGRLLLLEEGHCFRDQALAACALPGTAARDGLDGSTLATLVQMVAAGLGRTLIPAMARPVECAGAAVDVVPLPPPEPHREVGFVWRRSSPLAPRFAALAEIAREAVAGSGECGRAALEQAKEELAP